MFNNYILVSPSLWYDDKYIFRLLKNGKKSYPTTPTKIYLSAGEFETPDHQPIKNNLVEDAKLFTKKVQEGNNPNIEIRMQVVEGAVHNTAFPEPMARALYWMLKGDGMP